MTAQLSLRQESFYSRARDGNFNEMMRSSMSEINRESTSRSPPRSASGTAVRVAIVIPEAMPGRGGISRVTAYQTEYMSVHFPDIIFSVFRSRYNGRPVLRHLSAPLALIVFAVGLVWRRVEIVHINVAPRGSTWRKLLYATVARSLGRKVILHLHGSGYNDFYRGLSPKRQAIVRWFFRRADRVIALSAFWRRFLSAELRLPDASVAVIPNGVPASSLHSSNRAMVSQAPVILFLGVVGHRKGIDVLIDAMVELRRRGLTFSAIIGGDGEVKPAIDRVMKLGLSDVVSFLGWIDEVGPLLDKSDVFVLPSRAENQPVSILEAMAHAVPVVATTVGAIPEQVVDGKTGLLVPPGEAAPLADALQKLIESPALRRVMGDLGLQRFRAEFSVATSAERIAELYRSLHATAYSIRR